MGTAERYHELTRLHAAVTGRKKGYERQIHDLLKIPEHLRTQRNRREIGMYNEESSVCGAQLRAIENEIYDLTHRKYSPPKEELEHSHSDSEDSSDGESAFFFSWK